jgi:hypothetical protein
VPLRVIDEFGVQGSEGVPISLSETSEPESNSVAGEIVSSESDDNIWVAPKLSSEEIGESSGSEQAEGRFATWRFDVI